MISDSDLKMFFLHKRFICRRKHADVYVEIDENLFSLQVCGQGIIDLGDDESRNITSPYFYKWGMYPTGKNCVWLVKVSLSPHTVS